MKEQIKEMINELKRDVDVLNMEVKEKQSKLVALQLVVIQLQEILKNEVR